MRSITLRYPFEAARLARDLEKDLGHLRRRGIDPSRFLGGALARIARRVSSIAAV